MKNSDDDKDKKEDKMDNKDFKVEIFNRINRLKMKAGGDAQNSESRGEIDTKAVEKANQVIEKAAEMYPMQIRNILKILNKEWNRVKKLPPEDRHDNSEKLSNLANNICDLANQFGFDIMGHFGASLRDFLLISDMSKEEHTIIVQAHVDVMEIAYNEGLNDNEDPLAEELKEVVAKAIEKHH
jgi:hypothetical protein